MRSQSETRHTHEADGDAQSKGENTEQEVVSEIPSRAFVTATVWCVPFFGSVGLFNKLKRKKTKMSQRELCRPGRHVDAYLGRRPGPAWAAEVPG